MLKQKWCDILAGLSLESVLVPGSGVGDRLTVTLVPPPPNHDVADAQLPTQGVELLEFVSKSTDSTILLKHLVEEVSKHLGSSIGLDEQRRRIVALNLIAVAVIGRIDPQDRFQLLNSLIAPSEVPVTIDVALGNSARGGGLVSLGNIHIRPFDPKFTLTIVEGLGASGLRPYLERLEGLRSVLWHGNRPAVHPKMVMSARSFEIERLSESDRLRLRAIADNIYYEQAIDIWGTILEQVKREESLFAALDLPIVGVRVHKLFLADDRGIIAFGQGSDDGWVIPLNVGTRVSHRTAHGERTENLRDAIERHFFAKPVTASEALTRRLKDVAERASDAKVLEQLGFEWHALVEYLSALETVWARPRGQKHRDLSRVLSRYSATVLKRSVGTSIQDARRMLGRIYDARSGFVHGSDERSLTVRGEMLDFVRVAVKAHIQWILSLATVNRSTDDWDQILREMDAIATLHEAEGDYSQLLPSLGLPFSLLTPDAWQETPAGVVIH